MKILLVQSKYIIEGTGGVEKMCCFFANAFVNNGHDVEIATMEDVEGDKPQFYLDSRVRVKNLFNRDIPQLGIKQLKPFIYNGKNPIKWIYYKYKKKQAKFYNNKIYKKLGGRVKAFEYDLRNRSSVWSNYINEFSPNIIITMFLNCLHEITFEESYAIPIVGSINEHPTCSNIDIHLKEWRGTPKYISDLYNNFSGVQILFDRYKKFLPKTFSGKVFAIPNPVEQVDPNDIVEHSNGKERMIIINVARLVDDCKQQSKAIEVFSKLANKYPKWELHFWGIGKDELILREKIAKLGLSDRIFLKGFTDNPIEKLKESDIFLFPSKYEGWGLALTEAMSVGLPSVGFEYCSGVNELIEHDKNGFLAKDETEMQEYIERLMNDSNLRNKLGKQANKDMEKYSPDIVAEKWNELINTVTKK